MATTTHLNNPQGQHPVYTTATKAPGQRAGDPHGRQPTASPCRRRLNPVTVGFWLGGLVLGTGGAVVGACMPYHHPVAVTLSILWWGIYLGCFGASLGAVFALWKNRTPWRGGRYG
jgi:hypothetical protein